MRLAFAILAAAVALTCAAPAFAQPDARASLSARLAALKHAREEPPSSERTARIARLADELFDFDELARRAAGRHWAQRTPAERARFVDALRRLTARGFEGRLGRIAAVRSFEPERTDGDETVVTTSAPFSLLGWSDEAPARVAYHLRPAGGTWRVVDLTIDDLVLTESYRSQIDRFVRREGWDAVVARMEARAEQPPD